jgi:glutamyl-tRNA reductase
MHGVADEELQRTMERLGSMAPEQREEIERLVRRVVNKMLHGPTLAIKEASRQGAQAETFLQAVLKMFGLQR